MMTFKLITIHKFLICLGDVNSGKIYGSFFPVYKLFVFDIHMLKKAVESCPNKI